MQINGTLFQSLFDVKTNKKIEIKSFSDFEHVLYKLSEIKRESKKSAELMSPATYLPNTKRANDNVVKWGGWCAVDVDDFECTTETFKDELTERFKQYNFVCYSTASSTAEQPKFRLVFPLTSDVSKDKIKHFWYALNTELGDMADTQTKDLSRMYYLPGTYKDAFNFIFSNHNGKSVDPKELMDKHVYVEKSGNTMFDRLPKKMQDQIMQHFKAKLTNTDVKWTSYRDCPYFPSHLANEYKTISNTGWYYKMYQIMVALAGNAIKNKYPITANEIAYMCREFDLDTGNWYENRPLQKEATRALDYVYKNLL